MSGIDTSSKEKLALVVDDSLMQCTILSHLLGEQSYQVVTANNGKEAIEMYIKHQPDLVLMDINMPVMNGYEAAKKIKKISHEDSLAPLIFITSLDSDEAYIDSIEAGGDGVLVRPFSSEVFKAKIKSIQRISDLYSQVKLLQHEQQKDAELAEKLMSDVIESRNVLLDRIDIAKQPAMLFSGDIQLTALCPNGDVHALLGDFTGHGLRSSIGAIPLAETFRAMTRKGFSFEQIIKQVNQQLYHLLPKDLFLAVAFVKISISEDVLYAFNAGLPDIYVIDNEANIKEKLPSIHPPLGVLERLFDDVNVSVLPIANNDNVVMVSDGVLEARSPEGEMYDIFRFEQCIKSFADQDDIAQRLMQEINQFSAGGVQEDDLSIIVLPCGGWESSSQVLTKAPFDQELTIEELDNALLLWQWQLVLNAEKLVTVNPIPIAMSQMQELEEENDHFQSIYTIFTELFVNALDHGLLKLDSTLKSTAEGFATYYQERQQRLTNLTEGSIEIDLSLYKTANNNKLIIKVSDTGSGFDVEQYIDDNKNNQADITKLSGRGVELVKELSYSLEYNSTGNVVEVSYIW